jgi:hypothetical protein
LDQVMPPGDGAKRRRDKSPCDGPKGQDRGMIVGTVPCTVALEIHVAGRCIARTEVKGATASIDVMHGPALKCTRRLIAEGRVIVGPGYSTCGEINGQMNVDRTMHARRREGGSILRAQSTQTVWPGNTSQTDGASTSPAAKPGMPMGWIMVETAERRMPAP